MIGALLIAGTTAARAWVMGRTLTVDPDNTLFVTEGRRLWQGERLYTGGMPANRTPLMSYVLGWAPSIGAARVACGVLGLAAVGATALLGFACLGWSGALVAVLWLLSQGVFVGALVDHSYHGLVGALLAVGTWGVVTEYPALVVGAAFLIAAARLFYVPLFGLAVAWACWQGAWWALVAFVPVALFLGRAHRRALLAYVPGLRWATSATVAPQFRWAVVGVGGPINGSWREAVALAWRQYRLVGLGVAAAVVTGHVPIVPLVVLLLALGCAGTAVPFAASALGYVQTLGPLLAVVAAAAPLPLVLACLIAGPWSSRPLGLPPSRADRWTQLAQSAAFALAIGVLGS